MIDTNDNILKQNLSNSDKVNYIINHSVFSDSEWNKLSQLNKSLCINIGTSFSGIGSPEFAIKRLGIKHNILFAGDIDDNCKETYFANYKISEENWHKDVRLFDACKFLNNVDLYVGGSPCQSFSIGGKRKGLEESRGTLFYEYARLVKECSPKVFIYENVTGMLNHDGGRTWKIISEIFNELGYFWTYWILNSKDFGIPQNRKRIYVVGFRKDFKEFFAKLQTPTPQELHFEVKDFLEDNILNKYYLPEKGFLRVVDPKHNRHVVLNSRIARTQIANQQFNWYGDIRIEYNIPERLEHDERIFKGFYKGSRCVARCLTPRECLRLMGYSDDFNIVVNDMQQYRQSGNSIVVNVMMEVVKSIFKTGVYYGK